VIGLDATPAFAVTVGLVCLTATVNLRVASGIFATCLIASNAALVYVMVANNGTQIYVHAVPLFFHDAHSIPPLELITTVVGVLFLVVTGADYQQFVIEGRSPSDAVIGTILAGIGLLVIGFLPAAAVMAITTNGAIFALENPKEVIPFVLSTTLGQF